MTNTFTLSEKSLIKNCINRNRKSQKELFERFSPKMFALCLHYAKNQIDAEDILQNAFVKLFSNLHKFKGEESLEEWLRKIVISIATEYTKRNKVKATIVEDLKNRITGEHITALDELYETIYTKTSDKFRKEKNSVFQLYAIDGYAVKETIDKSGMSEGNAETQLPAEKKSLIKVVQKTAANKQQAKLKYTIQKRDDRRLNRDGVLRVYNLSEPIDIPVRKLLGKWRKEHIGVTLILVNGKWHIEGERVEHTIKRQVNSTIGLKHLLKFV